MLEDRRDFIRLTLASAGTGFGLAGRAAASQRNEAATASGATPPLYLVVYHRGLRWIDGRPTAEQPGIKEHFLYYLDLYRRGHLRFGGGFADDSGGAAVFEATDDAAAASFVAADPAVRSEAFRYELKRWTLQPWEEILKQRGALPGSVTARPQEPAPAWVYESPGGVTLRVLLDQQALGGAEVEVGELTFPPNSDTSDHQHGVSESFYVLEGELDHVVNSRSVKLSAGMVGSVRPPDVVRHRTGAAGARALVIWAPGGEIARVTSRWRARK
jgi:quercetin dioxygenase-like cupin family protein/uncharacterized protein YciI